MARFSYKSVSREGRLVEGEIEAADRATAIRRLQADGQMPISAESRSKPVTLARMGTRLRRWKERLRHDDVTMMTRELATLLGAGLTLDASIRTMQHHAASERLRPLLEDMHADVQSGRPLSRALAKHPGIFDGFYVSLVRAGEAGGALDVVLERLASHREHEAAFRSSMVASLTYPMILLAVAALSLFALMTFVVPRFVPLFSDAGTPLPLLTELVFSTAELFRAYWWTLIGLAVGAKVAADRWLERPANRPRLHEWVLEAPLIGEPILFAETARFSRTVATLLRNGLTLVEALELSREVLSNSRIAGAVGRCIEAVRSGGRVAQALRSEAVLPRLAVELITVGEESAQLEEMLEKCADAFEGKARQKLKRLVTLLEPILILGLGGAIGFVIVAILLAMLGLNDLIV